MSNNLYKIELENKIIAGLQTVFDPEIPVNIYELGLIYGIHIDDDNNVTIEMTLTAPNCPEAENIPVWVENALLLIEGVNKVVVKIVFDPPWTIANLSEEAKLDLGLL